MALPTHCIYEAGNYRSIWDHAPNQESAEAYAKRKTEETGKPYVACTLDDFVKLSVQWWLAQGPLREITSETYFDALECLPPIYRHGALRGFFMSEFTSGTVTNQYVERDGRFYVAAADITNPATWITLDDLTRYDWPEWKVTGSDQAQGSIGAHEPFSVTVKALTREDAWQAAWHAREALGRQHFMASRVERIETVEDEPA